MKRGGPLVRRTPLTSSTPLSRRQPISKVSARRRCDNAHRAVVVSAMRKAVMGRCARCGSDRDVIHGHERLGRAQGGDILQPDCLLCIDCNGWCEDNPRIAAFTGWKVSSKWPHDHTLTVDQAWALDGSIVEFTVADDEVA